MGRILALDYGRKRIGLSISDETKTLAQILVPPLLNGPGFLKKISQVIRRYEIERLVVGLPKTLAGDRGAMEGEAEEFAGRLKSAFSLPVELLDERFTTRAAEKMLAKEGAGRQDRKMLKDNLAAQLLLERYLQTKIHD